MTKTRGLLVFACALLLVGVAVWRHEASDSDREMARLAAKLHEGENYLTNAELRNLVRQRSTQAVECALTLINRKDPAWKKLLMELDRKVASIDLNWDTDAERGFRATKLLFVIGNSASNFAPAFVELLQDSRHSFYGQLALMFVGEAALPAVTNLFTHDDKRVRADAAFTFNKIKGNRSFTILWKEAGTGKMIYAPVMSIDNDDILSLAGMLTNVSARMRRAAAEALEQHSGIARLAVPALKEALLDKDPEVRASAKAALNAIAPPSSQTP